MPNLLFGQEMQQDAAPPNAPPADAPSAAEVQVADIAWQQTQQYTICDTLRTVYAGYYLGIEIMRSVEQHFARPTEEWFVAIGVPNSQITKDWHRTITDIESWQQNKKQSQHTSAKSSLR